MKKAHDTATSEWTRFDAMTDEERSSAARADRDAQPLSESDLRRMKRTPQAQVFRRALNLSRKSR